MSIIGPAGQSAVGSDQQHFSNSSNTTSSSSPIFAAIGSVREKLIQLAISVQSKEPIRENLNILMLSILQIYIIISSLFLPAITLGSTVDIYNSTLAFGSSNGTTDPTINANLSFNSTSHSLGSYRYGYYGYWIFNILTYPTTLSLDRIPYYGIVGLSFTCMVFIIVYITLVVFTYRGMLLSSNHFWRLKLMVRRCSACLILCSLSMTFIMTSFIDCNYFSGLLNRFPSEDVKCFSIENIVYIVIFFVTIFSLWGCLGFAQFVLPNTHPHSRTLFVAQTTFATTFYWVATNVEMAVIFVIPQSYGRSIAHLIFSALSIPIFFNSVPFFRRFENSIFFGVICGKLGLALGSLISSFSNPDNIWDLGLGLAGLSFGLLIAFFVCGCAFMEIYTKMVYRSTRDVLVTNNLQENDSERDALVQYQFFEDTKKLKYLAMFLRYAVRSGNSEAGSDIDIAIQFIKSLIQHKSFNDTDTLVASSIIIAFCWTTEANSCAFGLRLVRTALKQHGTKFLSKLSLMERMRQIEYYSDSMLSSKKNNSELTRVLVRLERQQTELLSHHKTFWKEMINDLLDYEKLEHITNRISSLSTECDTTFENLQSTYGNEKTLLRKYAYFVENFKFDSVLAQQFYTEASIIEEEESRTRKKMAWQEFKYRGIVTSSNSMVEPYEQTKKQESAGFIREETATESAEIADHKKETMLKSALRIPDNNKRPKFVIVSWTILSIALICLFVIISTIFSVLPTREIYHLKNSCQPKGISSRIATEVRTAQMLLELYSDEHLADFINQHFGINTSQSIVTDFRGRVDTIFESITQVSKTNEGETVISDGYAIYTNPIYNVTIPSMDKNSTSKSKEPRFTQTIDQTISILDTTHMVINHKTTISKYSDIDLKKGAENFSVMFFLKNRGTLDEIYADFCDKYSAITYTNTENYVYAFLGILLGVLVLYCLGGILVFVLTASSLFKTNELLKLLEKDVPKAVATSIVAQISKKCDEEVSLKTTSYFFQAKRMILVLGVVLLIGTMVSFTMLFVSAYINNNLTLSTISSLKLVSDSKIKLESANFQIGELFIYKKLNGTYNSNDLGITSTETISQYYSNIKINLEGTLRVWNQAILGMDISSNQRLANIVTGSSCNTSSSCIGLNGLLSEFVVSSQQLVEKIQSESFPYSTLSLLEEYLTLFFLGNTLNSKLMYLEDYFVTLNSSPTISILLAFSILGLVQCVVLSYLLFNAYNLHWRNIHQTRLLLNYIPFENLDSNEKLKNFVLYHDISQTDGVISKSIFSRKKNHQYKEGNEDRVRSILGASVDGAILCNQSGDIEIFNPAAQKLFGHKPHEIVGLSVFTLFEPASNSKIKQLMEEMSTTLIENINNKLSEPIEGETLEVECFRKNQSKFPTRINFFCTLFGRTPVVTFFVKDITAERKQNLLLAEEKKKSEALLLNILPESVAIRLKSGETYIAEKYADVTVFFSDMVGFTKLSSNMEAIELVKMLSIIVNGFDSLTDKYQLEKIKTIGDAYFCVGLTGKDHPDRVVKFAIEVFTVIHNYNVELIKDDRSMKIPKKFDENGVEIPVEQRQLNLRVGANSGSVVAGVIGSKKFAYDLWGDTINMASRMESTSENGRIQISKTTYERVYTLGYRFEERQLDVKGKGICECYLLDSRFHLPPVLDEIAIKKLFSDEENLQTPLDEFADIDLYRSDSYRFARLIAEHSFIASFKLYLSGPKLDIITFYERVLEFKQTESVPVRYEIAKNLVELYLQEKATSRLNFKFMKNAFGPFQLKFITCTEENCPTELFDNFVNLSTRTLKPELPKFLKSSLFSTYVENIKIADPDLLKTLIKSSKNENTTDTSSDYYDEDEEKEFLLFCEKCGTEIINLENQRFNDFEFNYRIDNLIDYHQWRVLNEYKDGKTFLSPEVAHNHLSNSRRHTQIKYSFEVDLGYEKVFNLWMDTDYYTIRDPNICSFKPVDFVKVGKYAHGIAHEVYKFNGLGQSDREIVHAYCCRFDADKKRYLCISRSINNPKVLESSKYTRAEIKTAFMVEYLEKHKSRYTYAVIFDPMGMLGPDNFYQSIKDGKDNYHKLFKDQLVERGTKKNHDRPSSGMFVESLNHYISFMEEKQKRREQRQLQSKEQ